MNEVTKKNKTPAPFFTSFRQVLSHFSPRKLLRLSHSKFRQWTEQNKIWTRAEGKKGENSIWRKFAIFGHTSRTNVQQLTVHWMELRNKGRNAAVKRSRFRRHYGHSSKRDKNGLYRGGNELRISHLAIFALACRSLPSLLPTCRDQH